MASPAPVIAPRRLIAPFGLGHTYQGWKLVFVITLLGLLYGWLAHWRRNLRANMISHAWSDMFAGYFAFL